MGYRCVVVGLQKVLCAHVASVFADLYRTYCDMYLTSNSLRVFSPQRTAICNCNKTFVTNSLSPYDVTVLHIPSLASS